jgi:hypothetical protein
MSEVPTLATVSTPRSVGRIGPADPALMGQVSAARKSAFIGRLRIAGRRESEPSHGLDWAASTLFQQDSQPWAAASSSFPSPS